MKVKVLLEAHAYAGNEIRDYYFEERPSYAIAGPEAMEPLDRLRNKYYEFEYSPGLTLSGFEKMVKQLVFGDDLEEYGDLADFYLKYDDQRFLIYDQDASFEYIRKKYLDPMNTEMVTVCFMVSHNAGVIDPKDGPLRFEVHSHEAGKHHEAHIHVKELNKGNEASYRIRDGKRMDGFLPRKYEKIAVSTISKDKEYYFWCWNTMSDGLKVDINYYLKYVC